MSGRALTPDAKRAIIERLLAAWERVPYQRLGQLMVNACNDHALAGAVGMFGVEDDALVGFAEQFAADAIVVVAGKDGGA